ncbi:MAG: AMP-binding protein, partial [Muribaculaceae bacterium]
MESMHKDLRGCDIITVYQQSFIDNFPLPAVTDFTTGKTLTYGEMAKHIARLHLYFDSIGIRPGDKIALLGKNTSRWIYIFMASLTYGSVIVPILNDFNPVDATHII